MTRHAPFFIAALPRSRTCWLSNLLTWDSSFCFHEAIVQCQDVASLNRHFENVSRGTIYVGDSDPSIGLVAGQVLQHFPNSKFVFVRRPVGECVEAEFAAMIEDGNQVFFGTSKESIRERVEAAQNGLNQLWQGLPTRQKLFLEYVELDSETAVKTIWEFCVPGIPFPEQRYRQLDQFRVTQVFSKVIKKFNLDEGVLAR